MKEVKIEWQGSVSAEVRNFNGFKYYINYDMRDEETKRLYFNVFMILSETELSKESIRGRCKERAEASGLTLIKARIWDVTKLKKYN